METKKRLWGAVALFAAAGFLSVPNLSAQTLVVEEEIVEVQAVTRYAVLQQQRGEKQLVYVGGCRHTDLRQVAPPW